MGRRFGGLWGGRWGSVLFLGKRRIYESDALVRRRRLEDSEFFIKKEVWVWGGLGVVYSNGVLKCENMDRYTGGF